MLIVILAILVTALCTTIVNHRISNKKIQSINLEHIEENDQLFNRTFENAYESGKQQGVHIGRMEILNKQINQN